MPRFLAVSYSRLYPELSFFYHTISLLLNPFPPLLYTHYMCSVYLYHTLAFLSPKPHCPPVHLRLNFPLNYILAYPFLPHYMYPCLSSSYLTESQLISSYHTVSLPISFLSHCIPACLYPTTLYPCLSPSYRAVSLPVSILPHCIHAYLLLIALYPCLSPSYHIVSLPVSFLSHCTVSLPISFSSHCIPACLLQNSS
jgi:hypothetical protein